METTLVVIDNFYSDPLEIRKTALAQPFEVSGNYPGRRTKAFAWPWVREAIERALESCAGKITEWKTDDESYNGAFQITYATDRSWVHADPFNNWAGVLFLTPNAPLSGGTNLYRHKYSGHFSKPEKPLDEALSADSNDLTRWELVDRVGNRFNRLVLFRSQNYHMSGDYFGMSVEECRLFQVFFFNTT